ncbi:hypothetical protein DFA_02011 [Cavenderia fasciculata]|uniref:Protein kinase domain-containing protein n=1 Tax=Cavenderia fasciculata TaxID=261658 RepID=F4PYG0_CACFS|nr:uncharacterized protein DFA_02011 [Cavenderia fasciculata]EGG19226.1 hypothetical protein DFA_02011 [Cavenderia fasciculata]|eukprot:XP_004357497.1 hypothetical protein DFA_02011 [Cavenderia fasciculata]
MDYKQRNSTLFPWDITIQDCREATANVPGFRETNKQGIICFNYDYATRNSFPSYSTDEKTKFLLKVRRECRGILFEETTGRLLCRKFHKFFNINEMEETHQDKIDITQPHVIMEKLDGSLIAPIYLKDTVSWGSKAGATELSVKVEKYIATKTGSIRYDEFAAHWLKQGYTPMFEWCSESQRIVLYYAADLLALTAIRNIKTGEYIPYDDMVKSAAEFSVPYTGKLEQSAHPSLKNCKNTAELLAAVQAMKDIEGYILRFDSGHVYKMKCEWYFDLSKSSSINLNQEKDIWMLILDKKLDDTVAQLSAMGPLPIRYQRIQQFAIDLFAAIEQTSSRIIENLAQYRKEGKLRKHIQGLRDIPSFEKKMIFHLWDDEEDEPVAVQKNKVTRNIISLIKTNCSSSSKLDEARNWIGDQRQVVQVTAAAVSCHGAVGVLPSSLQSLMFGDDYDQPLSVGVLPSSLQSLMFGYYYNQALSVGVLPSSLQSLVFGDEYNQLLSVGVLPSSLQSLEFGDEYNQPLSVGVLPSTLQSLKFGGGYNQPLSVGVLPTSLQSLEFGYYYNQPLSVGVLPSSLQSLEFGDRYNQALSVGVLPSSLQSLVFGRFYNQPLSVGVLPTSLQSLEFGDTYNQSRDSIPSLRLLVDFNQSISLSRNFLIVGSYEVIKLPKTTYPLILSTTFPPDSDYHVDEFDILTNNIQSEQLITTLNPNSINYDPKHLMSYPISHRDYISINNNKYFKLHSFPYSTNKVILVMCESSNELYVYKEIDYSKKNQNEIENNRKEIDQSIYDKIQFEISTMKLFTNDDMFIQYKDHQDDIDSKKINILTHFCEGGDLEQLFQSIYKWNGSQQGKQNPEYKYILESEIWVYINRLFQILEKLSQHNLAHLDIKPLNLFIGHDGQIVLGDFGCCHYFVDQNHSVDHAINDTAEQTTRYANIVATCIPWNKRVLLSYHIKISTDRYSDDLINFVKKLLIATPHDRLSLDDLNGEIVNQHTQRISSFLINRRQILSSTTTLILDGEFNSPLKGLLPPTLLKLKLLGKFNQPIGWRDIPDSVETLIFGPSFNSEIKLSPLSLKILILGKSFNKPLVEEMPSFSLFLKYRNSNRYNIYRHNDPDQTIVNSYIKNNVREPKAILSINEQCYGIGSIERNDKLLDWMNNHTKFSINLGHVKVISHVKVSTHPHLYCQINRSKFEQTNRHFRNFNMDSQKYNKEIKKLFELDQDNIHQEFEHNNNNQYLNIRLLILKPSQLDDTVNLLDVLSNQVFNATPSPDKTNQNFTKKF